MAFLLPWASFLKTVDLLFLGFFFRKCIKVSVVFFGLFFITAQYVFEKEAEGSKKATLHYTTIKNLENYSLLEIDLETGRHHQIRAQLSFIGSPIKGDLKYGASRSNKDGSIHLHARKINFTHPVSKKIITLVAPTPSEAIWNACMDWLYLEILF